MAIDIRPYRPGDERAICALFETVFGRPMSLDYWAWRYRDHPSGGPYAELCWDGERLAGHYAVCAADLAVRGERRRACLSMTTMVHPDYRGQGLFERSAEQLYARLDAEGFAMVMGFPNAQSNRGFIGKLGWGGIYELPTLAAGTEGRRPRAPEAVAPLDVFDARFDAFWELERKAGRPLRVWRDAAQLVWRFARNPDHAYAGAVLADRDGSLRGYAVGKAYASESFDLVELAALDPEARAGLLAWALEEAARRALPRVAAWVQPGDPARLGMESLGFRAVGPVTYFGARAFSAYDGPDPLDHRNWRLTMADSDVF